MKTCSSTSILAMTALVLASVLPMSAQNPAREIPIVAKKFGYAPSEVRLKKGETVTLLLKTEDVAHGLKSDDLKFNAQIVPGEETKVTVTPEKAGQFTAICSKFCGSGHFSMKMTFVVEE
jgi:cytochrome c oxidase subunit 2